MPPRRKSVWINRGQPPPQTEQTLPAPPPQGGLPKSSSELEQLISQRVTIALANAATVRNGTYGVENGGKGNRRDSNSRGDQRRPQRTCTYKDYMYCKPKNFYGNEGFISMNGWIERME